MALSVPKASTSKPRTNVFGEVSAVASGATVSVVTHTVPVGKTFLLELVEFSGENIADYELFVDGVKQAKKRTYFSGALSGEFFFGALTVTSGKVIDLKVENFRPSSADFEGRILGVTQ